MKIITDILIVHKHIVGGSQSSTNADIVIGKQHFYYVYLNISPQLWIT